MKPEQKPYRLALLALVALASVSRSVGQNGPPLKVAYLPATHHTLLFIAAEQGFFRNEGLNVNLRAFSNSAEIMLALNTEEVDVGLPGVAAPIFAIANGRNLTIFGGAAKRSAAVVVPSRLASKFSNAKTVQAKMKAFSGFKVGTVRMSTGDSLFRQALATYGLRSAVDVREFSSPRDALNALKNESIDAAVLWSPHMSTAERLGMVTVLWTTELLADHVCCRQVANDRCVRDRRPDLVKFSRALILAMKYYKVPENRDAVLQIAQKYIKSVTSDILEQELYGTAPRTTISVDLAEEGTLNYLKSIQNSENLKPGQSQIVGKRIDRQIMIDAYTPLVSSVAVAKNCVDKGFDSCPLKK